MGLEPKKSALVNFFAILVLSMPCILGMNVLSGVSILGLGIMDFEDFLISDNLLPLGSLVYLLFCVTKKGWGWDRFREEANTGKGLSFPKGIRFYVTWILPAIILVILVLGYWSRFFK